MQVGEGAVPMTGRSLHFLATCAAGGGEEGQGRLPGRLEGQGAPEAGDQVVVWCSGREGGGEGRVRRPGRLQGVPQGVLSSSAALRSRALPARPDFVVRFACSGRHAFFSGRGGRGGSALPVLRPGREFT
eukprot:4880990-Heterocapsa_arctica.AAC.1